MSTDPGISWLIQENTFNERAHSRLLEALSRREMAMVVVRYLPFGAGDYQAYFPDTDRVIAMGSLNFIQRIQRERPDWRPNSWCNLPALRCSTYYAYWGGYLLNHDYVMLPLAELGRRKEWLYRHLGVQDCLFIRPDSGDKGFSGAVVSRDDFDRVYGQIASQCERTELVLASSPKNVDEEWRFIIGDHRVVTGSLYWKEGRDQQEPARDDRAWELASEIARTKFAPDPMYSMDICRTGDEYRLLEIGSFSCSGLYECDVDAVVEEAVRILGSAVDPEGGE